MNPSVPIFILKLMAHVKYFEIIFRSASIASNLLCLFGYLENGLKLCIIPYHSGILFTEGILCLSTLVFV